jgi:hypothetical protein
LVLEAGEAGAVGPAADARLLVPLLRSALRRRGLSLIRPALGPDGVAYPEAEALFSTRGPESTRLLETLTLLGLFEKHLLGTFRPISGGPEEPVYIYALAGGDAGGGDGPGRLLHLLEEVLRRLDRLLERDAAARRAAPPGGRAGLSPHIYRTYQALRLRGSATAIEVAAETGRSRSLENAYLNQLAALGLASKRRVGRVVVFEAVEAAPEPGQAVEATQTQK